MSNAAGKRLERTKTASTKSIADICLDIEDLVPKETFEPSTDSESSLSRAREWIRLCTASHHSCQPLRTAISFRPTRLLKVSGPLDIDGIRLIEKDEIPNEVTYTTLSHCWGLVLQFKLTSKNIDSLKKGISLAELAKTFQDAVEVTRRLGVDYIWIDCFCIIQDSPDDWAHESVLMQHVYGHSYCNIAATDSHDGRGGCFRTRDTNALKPLRVGFTDYYLLDVGIWWNHFKNGPLNRRAWVLQERLLAPRVLHFDRDQLVWECSELTACERFPTGFNDLITGPLLRTPLESTLRSALETGPQGRAIYDIWKPIVQAYTSSALTKESDRLIALHGVAMKIKELLGCQYAAGLFSKDMESQLAWKVINNANSSRSATPIAPSWSWASITGPIGMLHQWDQCRGQETWQELDPMRIDEQYLCEILNKDDVGSRNTTSMASHEELEVRCYLSPVYYVTDSETRLWTKARYVLAQDSRKDCQSSEPHPVGISLPRGDDTWPLQWDGVGGGGSYRRHRTYHGDQGPSVFVSSIKGDEDSTFYINIFYDIASEYKRQQKRWLMPVNSNTEVAPVAPFYAIHCRCINGLVLERREEDGGKFRRCGTFKISAEDNSTSQIKFWEGALRWDTEGVKKENCDGVLFPTFQEVDIVEEVFRLRGSKLKYVARNKVPQYFISIM